MTSKSDINWNLNFQKLIDFYEIYKVFPNKNKNEELAKWVSSQKYNKKLKPERVQKLNALPFWKWPKSENIIVIDDDSDDDVEFIEVVQKRNKISIDDNGELVIPKIKNNKNNLLTKPDFNKRHQAAYFFYPEKRSFLKNNFVKIIDKDTSYKPIPPDFQDNTSDSQDIYIPTNISICIPLQKSIYDVPPNSEYINKIYKIK